jgi:hypothetical protein
MHVLRNLSVETHTTHTRANASNQPVQLTSRGVAHVLARGLWVAAQGVSDMTHSDEMTAPIVSPPSDLSCEAHNHVRHTPYTFGHVTHRYRTRLRSPGF